MELKYNNIDYLNESISVLPQEDREKLKSILSENFYKKGEIISNVKEIEEHIYIISRGGARVFYLKDGKEITFKEAVQQGPVIVSFWATWCKPCQSELEALKDLEDSWKNKVRIIAVSIDDARAMAKVKSLVKGKKWPFEVLLDPNKELYKAFNISAIPHVLVINDKKVVWTHSGYMPGNEVLVVDKALETIGKK